MPSTRAAPATTSTTSASLRCRPTAASANLRTCTSGFTVSTPFAHDEPLIDSGTHTLDTPVGCVNSISRADPWGLQGIECANPPRLASDGNRQPAALRGGELSLLLPGNYLRADTGSSRGCQHMRSVCKSSVSLVANRVLTPRLLIRGVAPVRRRM